MAIQSTTMKYGTPHITSAQMGSFNAGIFGTGAYVLNTRNKFALTVNSANSITIGTGDAVCNGRHFVLESPETLSVDSGTQSLKRKDLVCLRYTKSGDVETPSIVVIKGTASADPVDPQYNTGSIIDGATIVDFPLYRLNINGINFAGYDTIMSTPLIGGADVIVAEGTSGKWYWRKWESGFCEMYARGDLGTSDYNFDVLSNSRFYIFSLGQLAFPFTLTSLIAKGGHGRVANTYTFLAYMNSFDELNDTTIEFFSTYASRASVQYSVWVYGTWK